MTTIIPRADRWQGGVTIHERVTFWLLNVAVATRGIQVVVETGGSPALWPWVAVSGPLSVAALGVFTLALIRGARPARAA